MKDQVITVFTSAGIQFSIEPNCIPETFKIESTDLLKVSKLLQSDPSLYFDQLSCITGIDNGPEAKTMEVIYHFYSIPFHASLALKVVLPRESPETESLTSLWQSANWMEREVYDMFGIRFSNHPDLRRILMPNDWEGYPLRKDYHHQERYHGIKLD